MERVKKKDDEGEEERRKINEVAMGIADSYMNLRVGSVTVKTPFFSNELGITFGRLMDDAGVDPFTKEEIFGRIHNREISWGWYKGKGKPEQISEAALEIGEKWGLKLDNASPEAMVEFMKYAGLGVDCSGFIFNVLEQATSAVGKKEEFINSLDWLDGHEKTVYKAGVFVFAGKASAIIEPEEARELDIVILREGERIYSHIAMVLKKEKRLFVAQSVLGQVPTGINISELRVIDGMPDFGFTPNLTEKWENLYKQGKLEFRRLKIFT